jgi:hypothetical protein
MTVSTKQDNKIKSVIELVQESWLLYKNNLSILIGYSAWALIPMIANALIIIAFGSFSSLTVEILITSLDIAVVGWITACIIQASYKLLDKQKIDVRTISSQGWKLLIPMIILGFITGVLTLIGFLALIIPGIIIATMFAFSTQILVIENKKIIESIKESYSLSKGRLLAIFGRMLGSEIIILIPYFVVYIAIAIILLSMNNWDIDAFINSPTTLMEQIATRITDIIFMPLVLVFSVVFYKSVKESH